jgi:hypothetical protein
VKIIHIIIPKIGSGKKEHEKPKFLHKLSPSVVALAHSTLISETLHLITRVAQKVNFNFNLVTSPDNFVNLLPWFEQYINYSFNAYIKSASINTIDNNITYNTKAYDLGPLCVISCFFLLIDICWGTGEVSYTLASNDSFLVLRRMKHPLLIKQINSNIEESAIRVHRGDVSEQIILVFCCSIMLISYFQTSGETLKYLLFYMERKGKISKIMSSLINKIITMTAMSSLMRKNIERYLNLVHHRISTTSIRVINNLILKFKTKTQSAYANNLDIFATETLLDITPLVMTRLSHPTRPLRISILKLLNYFENSEIIKNSNSQTSMSSYYSGNIFTLLYNIERIQNKIHTERTKLHMTLELKTALEQRRIPQPKIYPVIYFLLGLLSTKFAPLLLSTVCVIDLAWQHYPEVTGPIVYNYLQQTQPVYKQENRNQFDIMNQKTKIKNSHNCILSKRIYFKVIESLVLFTSERMKKMSFLWENLFLSNANQILKVEFALRNKYWQTYIENWIKILLNIQDIRSLSKSDEIRQILITLLDELDITLHQDILKILRFFEPQCQNLCLKCLLESHDKETFKVTLSTLPTLSIQNARNKFLFTKILISYLYKTPVENIVNTQFII